MEHSTLINILIGAGIGALIVLFLTGGFTFTKIKKRKVISKHAAKKIKNEKEKLLEEAIIKIANITGNGNITEIQAIKEYNISDELIKKANFIQRANKDKANNYKDKIAEKAEKTI